MPYTLTMSLVWLVLVAVAGVVVGYLFRGRTSVVATGDRPLGGDATQTAQSASGHAEELRRLRQQVERLETQLSITVTERDRLRRQLGSVDPVDPVERDPLGSPGGRVLE